MWRSIYFMPGKFTPLLLSMCKWGIGLNESSQEVNWFVGFIIAMIILSAPLVLYFFSLGWSCLVFNVSVMFLNEFSQYKYSILSFSYSCIPVPELQVSLHALVPSPIANYCCLLLCTRIIFGLGIFLSFFPNLASCWWRPCVP